MSDESIFEDALLKIIDDKKDKALVLVETALSAWPEELLKDHSAWTPDEVASYFVGWVRRARAQMYSIDTFGKRRQEGSGGENG